MDIAFVTNSLIVENGLLFMFDYLHNQYDAQLVEPLDAQKSRLVITDIPEVVNQMDRPTFFIVTENNKQLLRNPSTRRKFVSNLKLAKCLFVYSHETYKIIRDEFRFKQCIVQYPYVPAMPLAKPEYILFEGNPDIVSGFPQDKVKEFSDIKDFSRAILFVYQSQYNELYNTLVPIATAHGVPSVVGECLGKEFVTTSDIVVPANSTNKKWEECIKKAMRDSNSNSDKIKKLRGKYQNMASMDSKIKQVMKGKVDNKALPSMAGALQQRNTNARREKMRLEKERTNREHIMRMVGSRNRSSKEPLSSLERASSKVCKSCIAVKKVPDWFTSKGEIDISIVVPMYKSDMVVAEQIKTWDLQDDGLRKEIIYVDDGCPQGSADAVLNAWQYRKKDLHGKHVGRIIISEDNLGYAAACNLGFNFSSGKTVIFLNADCFVKPNWIKPMYDLYMSNDEIGIVGNIQLRTNGNIDSAGSEFSLQTGHFEHIGKTVYRGKRLEKPFTLQTMPPELKIPGEREMVTGACFLIGSSIFEYVEGFDDGYQIGYWEDTDLNMKVRQAGFKVFFQPESVIYHRVGHSGKGAHPFKEYNKRRFYNRWVDTGILDQFIAAKGLPKNPNPTSIKSKIKGKVIGCIIACNEEEFLEASIESVSPIVDEYIMVIGGNKYAVMSDMCDSKGYPNDSTLKIAKKLATKYPITIIEPPGRPWKDKVEMRNAYANFLKPEDWMFVVDADEVYSESQLWRISELMQSWECIIMQFYLFWNDVDTLGTGAWEQYKQERIVKWKEGYYYRRPNHLHVSCSFGLVKDQVRCYQGEERLFYHYAYVRPIEKIQQKIDYYVHQLREEWKDPRGIEQNYVRDIFLKWRLDPTSVGFTHPRGGASKARPFFGMHPKSVAKMIQEGKLNF